MDYPNSISTHDFKFLTEPYEWSSDTVVREQILRTANEQGEIAT